MAHFRSSAWDPILISGQIVTMQCLYYISTGLWLTLLMGLFLSPSWTHAPTLHHIMSSTSMAWRDASGRVVLLSHLLNCISIPIGIWYVVQRSKQCLDFACTIWFFHWIACSIYQGSFTGNLVWWLLHLTCVTLQTVLAEYLCMHSELRAIPLSVGATTTGGNSITMSGSSESTMSLIRETAKSSTS
jgi:protein SYS1